MSRDSVQPATQEQIDKHNYHWNLPLYCFRRLFYTKNGQRVEHDTQPSADLLDVELAEIRESGGSDIAVYNSETGEPEPK